MTYRTTILAAAAAAAMAFPAFAQDRTPAPEAAQLYFVGLEDGMTVASPVTVRFGLSGMGVAPAGIEQDGTGHHHVLIDRPAFGEADGDDAILAQGIPADDTHRHFGGGQTEVTLDLAPGEHSLQLLLGDQNHVPHDPVVMSDRIVIVVE